MESVSTPNVNRDTFYSKERIKVFVRTRPLLDKEVEEGADDILCILPEEKKVLVDEGTKGIFSFDGVYDERVSQKEVFEATVSPVLKHVYDGQNVTVIAYGQTGSGKTYTIGTNPTYSKENEGMLQRVMVSLLKSSSENNLPEISSENSANIFSIKVTFLEVYNEAVYDLFNCRKNVEMKADGLGGVVPVNCKEEIIHNSEEGLLLLERGNNLRKVAATFMNAHSSRSHALISLTLCEKMSNGVDVPKGSLRMVDLAGAEGVGRHNTGAKSFSEGVNINKGLLAVGKVLTALSSNSLTSHIPYRESIVTRLLRDALGGNSYTSMIVCVSPASTNVTMTLNTLRYAEQAKNIKMKSSRLSTIKRKGIKRKSEDISATPYAWKKFASGKMMNHNSTISTPGHKPPIKKKQSFNNSFASPMNRMGDFKRPFPRSSSRNDLISIPDDLPLKQPVFEEEEEEGGGGVVSPAHSIISAPVINNTVIQCSPLIDRVSSRFEESFLQYTKKFQEQMEGMEARISKKVAQIIMTTSKAERKSRRLEDKEERKLRRSQISCIEQKDEKLNDSLNASFGQKESPFSFVESVASTILNKKHIRNALKMAIKEEQPCDQNVEVENKKKNKPNDETYRKPFGELQNISNLVQDGTHERSHENQRRSNLPITSTVAFSGKVVRRSTRHSARILNIGNRSISPVKDLSFSSKGTDGSITSHTCMEETVIFNPHQLHNSPELETKLLNVKRVTSPNQSCDKGEKDEQLSEESNMLFETTLFSTANSCKGTRRSTRRSALIATQKNAELLSGNNSPFYKASSRRNSTSRAKNVSKTRVNKTLDSSALENTIIENLGIDLSPTVKKQQSHRILKFLNSSNLRELQKLPTIGPKTAMVIYNFRNMFGNLETVDDLQKIPGLTKSFYSRFVKANLTFQ